MMRNCACTIVLVLLAFAAWTQDVKRFTVIKVEGQVTCERLGKILGSGDQILSNDKLRFGDEEAYIIVLNPSVGRKAIRKVPPATTKELTGLLKDFVSPERYMTASRSVSFYYMDELQGRLTHDTLLVLGDGFVSIDTAQLMLNDESVIKAEYRSGRDMVRQQVSRGPAVWLGNKQIFGHAMSAYPRVILTYYDDKEQDPIFDPPIPIAQFVPVYIDESSLKEEVAALVGAMKDADHKQVFKEITGYVGATYAPADETNLESWLDKNGLLTRE